VCVCVSVCVCLCVCVEQCAECNMGAKTKNQIKQQKKNQIRADDQRETGGNARSVTWQQSITPI